MKVRSIVPIRMASASWHALRVDAGKASPLSSIAHPPNKWDSSLRSNSEDFLDTSSKTLTASATTSGPALSLAFDFLGSVTVYNTNSVSGKDNYAESMCK